jgi:hypothetical protein
MLDGDFSPSLIPRESTRAALALHFQFGERKNGIWEFQSQEPSELRPGVKEFRRVFTRLAVSGRVNAHSSFRDEWLIRVEQLRSNFIRGVVKSISYPHVSSQMKPDLRLRLAVEVKPEACGKPAVSQAF